MTVYSALYGLLKANINLPLVRSGHIEDDSRAYVILSKNSNGIDTLDTCLTRLDQNIFQVNVYDISYQGLLDKMEQVELTLENKTLDLTTRRFTSLLYAGSNLTESTQGFYGGWVQWEIMTQKEFDSEDYQYNRISAKTFQEALFTQYRNRDSLNNKLNGFVTTKFGKGDWKRPFMFIPNIKINEDYRDTCLNRIENYQFSISVEGNDPDELEIILDEIDNTYSYTSMNLTGNRQWTSLQWVGDSLVELEPDLWLGSVDYSLLLEKV